MASVAVVEACDARTARFCPPRVAPLGVVEALRAGGVALYTPGTPAVGAAEVCRLRRGGRGDHGQDGGDGRGGETWFSAGHHLFHRADAVLS
jgi:hypothetical protein